jgi:hypothetical protein
MSELRRVPSPELRAVEHPRPTTATPERLASADRPSAPRIRAEAAEHRATSPPEPRDSVDSNRQQTDRIPESLARFEPRRAGLPDVSKDEANHYIETQRSDRPWLNSARHASPEVQQVFAALDQGNGHGHIRHEGWLTPEKSQLRVQYMQDPAQLDPVKRAEGKDGLLPDDKAHYCGAISAAIRDPSAFATAFARGIEHPGVRRALETPVEPRRRPESVNIPIRDLLGPEGHQSCEGYRLVGDTSLAARQERKTWLRETRAGETPSVPQPLLAPLDFRGGTIEFRFKANDARTGYEVLTMFPAPLDREPEHP